LVLVELAQMQEHLQHQPMVATQYSQPLHQLVVVLVVSTQLTTQVLLVVLAVVVL
jgi:hypothetical protein